MKTAYASRALFWLAIAISQAAILNLAADLVVARKKVEITVEPENAERTQYRADGDACIASLESMQSHP